jgi:hypothetical protein
LEENYPKEGTCLLRNYHDYGKRRGEVTELDISGQKLTGHLDLIDFGQLKRL